MKAPREPQPATPVTRSLAGQPTGTSQLRADESDRQGAQREYLGSLQTGARNGGLPAQLRSGLEALSGLDMSDVRVHRNSGKPAQLQAAAYAQGRDIHLAPGQDHHLPHEAWHVVQQRQGRVRATTDVAGVPVNDNPALEREADVMGRQAAQRAVSTHAPAESDKAHVDKTQGNESRSTADAVAKKRSGGKSTYQLAGSHPDATAQRKLQEMTNNSPPANRLKVAQATTGNQVAQRKYDHLFNDIPKTLSNLPNSLKSPKIEEIRASLNLLRDDHANGVQDLHAGTDQNAADFGFAQRSFLTAASSYAASEIDERAMREATYTLWKFSSDSDVAARLGNVSQKVKLWNSFEKKTWDALTEHSSAFD